MFSRPLNCNMPCSASGEGQEPESGCPLERERPEADDFERCPLQEYRKGCRNAGY